MKAVALANNSVGFIVWLPKDNKPIANCLGFALERINVETGEVTPLPSYVPFRGQKADGWKAQSTFVWPIQQFKWKDFGAKEGSKVKWRITPMAAAPGQTSPDKLVPMTELAVETNVVTLDTACGDFLRACFNRGILSTQALAHKLPKLPDGSPDPQKLIEAIKTPGSEIRQMLAGSMPAFIKEFIELAKKEGGHVYDALYELSDPEIVQFYLDNTDYFDMVLANAGKDDATNAPARAALRKKKAKVKDRFFDANGIGHNKSSVYVDKKKKPRRFMSGSINRTATGLCTQSNNALQVISDELAAYGLEYYKMLEADSEGGQALQSDAFRAANGKRKKDVVLADGTRLTVWFSPNTAKRTKPKDNPETPPDMQEVFDCMDEAREALYFLAFYPGFPSIISKCEELRLKKSELMIRGAVSSPQALPRNTRRGFVPKGAMQLYRPDGDSSIIAASALEKDVSRWVREILKLPDAHAIIHDKVVVINPMSKDCIVILGSHNLGYKASYQNDENLLIIRGNMRLAQAYMVHILDVYDHYNFRRVVGSGKSTFDGFLDTTPEWQDRKLSGRSLKELSYWLSGPDTVGGQSKTADPEKKPVRKRRLASTSEKRKTTLPKSA